MRTTLYWQKGVRVLRKIRMYSSYVRQFISEEMGMI